MSQTLGIVEVPPRHQERSEFRGDLVPLACRRFGDKSLVEWVVRRVTESMFLDHVVVVAERGYHASLDCLVPADVSLFLSDERDALGRVAAAVRRYDATQIVRVSVDRPFVDPELIERLVCTANKHPGTDYIGYIDPEGRRPVHARLGVFAEWCRGSAILMADSLATAAPDRADALHFVYSHPEEFLLRLIPVPAALNRGDVRLSIQSEEDFEHAQTIYEALGPDGLHWRRIADLLQHQPELRQRMADLNLAEHVTV